MKNYYYKRKNLLNNLIDHVDKLENVCLNNYVHKTYFLNYQKYEKVESEHKI